MKLTLRNIADRCRTETDAYELLEELRWHGKPVCPHCGYDEKCYFLKPANGETRATGPKRTMSPRRVWKCARCRKQFSVLTGTIFHGTKIPLRTWLLVLVQVSSAKNGMSAREVARMHEITEESAWFMVHRIREAMRRDPLAGLLSGVVVADETFIGGKPSNRHGHQSGKGWSPTGTDKTPVFSLVHKETGEVRSAVIPKVNGRNLRKHMEANVDLGATTLHTDTGAHYKHFKTEVADWQTVNHLEREYVRGDVSTNLAESYFAQLKRSIDGTHHNVSREHLPRYLAEFDFRWSTRKLSDSDRLRAIVGQSEGRRLSYEPLRGQ